MRVRRMIVLFAFACAPIQASADDTALTGAGIAKPLGVASAPQRAWGGASGLTMNRFAPLRDRGAPRSGDAMSIFSERDVGNVAYHVDATLTDAERRLAFGLTRGAMTAMLFTGSGEEFSRLDQAGPGLDPYFFHGGSAFDFDYHGAAADVAVARSVNLQFALSDIFAAGVDKRRSTYAGFTAGRAGAGWFSVSRESDVTATGFAWSYSGDRLTARFRQIDHESGARYRAFSLSGDRAGRGWYSLSVESGRNPLFSDNNETRWIARFGGAFGASSARLDTADPVESGPSGAPTAATSSRGRNLALIAGGVVAVGVASSSGSSSQDSAIRIRGQNNAAQQILNRINPVSVRQNREHGGWVYRNRDGTYGYTTPVAGSVASVDIGPKSSVPGGTQATASYHTHGGPDPRYNNEEFSPADILSDNLQSVDGYLGTPAGRFLLHVYRTQKIITLGTIAN